MTPEEAQELDYNSSAQRVFSDQDFDELLNNELDFKKYFAKYPSKEFMPQLKVVIKKDYDSEPEVIQECMAMHDVKRNQRQEINGVKLTLYAPVTDEKAAFSSPLLDSFYRGYTRAFINFLENEESQKRKQEERKKE